jgi:hypothetical protein
VRRESEITPVQVFSAAKIMAEACESTNESGTLPATQFPDRSLRASRFLVSITQRVCRAAWLVAVDDLRRLWFVANAVRAALDRPRHDPALRWWMVRRRVQDTRQCQNRADNPRYYRAIISHRSLPFSVAPLRLQRTNFAARNCSVSFRESHVFDYASRLLPARLEAAKIVGLSLFRLIRSLVQIRTVKPVMLSTLRLSHSSPRPCSRRAITVRVC